MGKFVFVDSIVIRISLKINSRKTKSRNKYSNPYLR